MARSREHLTRAPVREALVDIQFEPAVDIARIKLFVDSVAAEFDRVTPMIEAEFGMEADRARASQRSLGWRLDSDSRHYVLICRLGGFTLSRLSPYGTWGELRAEAERWWGRFAEATRPETVNRVAVRYINAIGIPLPMADFRDFLTCPPEIPPEMPQGLASFLSRMVIPFADQDCACIVTQALEAAQPAPDSPPSASVLLDIDVFRIVRYPALPWDGIARTLDTLREVKNLTFFSHITERTVEMFE